MNDKDIRNKYLTAEAETTEENSAAGWAAVQSSLKKRAGIRKAIYTAGSSISVIAIAALLYVGIKTPAPTLDEPGTPLLATAISDSDNESTVIPLSNETVAARTASLISREKTPGAVKKENASFVQREEIETGEVYDTVTEHPSTSQKEKENEKGKEETLQSRIKDNYYAEATVKDSRRNKQRIRVSFSASGLPESRGSITGGNVSAMTYTASPLGAAPMQIVDTEAKATDTGEYRDAQFRHSAPIGAELTIGIPVWNSKGTAWNAGGLTVESGLSYSYVKSDVLFQGHVNTDSQSLQFIGIPLRLRYAFGSNSSVSAYLSVGGKAEWAIDSRLAGEKQSEKGTQFSIGANAGLQWKAAERFTFYLQPELSYYLTETTLRTIRTDNPLSIGLSIGIGISL